MDCIASSLFFISIMSSNTTLTVFLVRCAETMDEVASSQQLRLHQQIDPPLSDHGYPHAQSTFLQLVSRICDNTPEPADRGDANHDGVIDPLRFLSCFTAPLKSCTGTAVLLSAAGLARQDKITWRYTTVPTATSPAAVPVIVDNELARGVPSIQQAGGVDTVVAAGLLHTAAADWNDAHPKCPILKVIVQEFKEKTQDFCREWKDDKTVHPPRKVLDVQYLRVRNSADGSPWDIQELSPKFNVTIDLLQPTKYLTPRRSGQFHCKLPGSEGNDIFRKNLEITCENGFRECVWKSRQVGCDTVILIVPPSTFTSIAKDVCHKHLDSVPPPCSVLTLLAHVNDANAAPGIAFEWVHMARSPTEIVVPTFPGPVNCIYPPPPEKDPASVPANQWSKFPPPEPEVIPPDYPDLYVPQTKRLYYIVFLVLLVLEEARNSFQSIHSFPIFPGHPFLEPCRNPFRMIGEHHHRHQIRDEEEHPPQQQDGLPLLVEEEHPVVEEDQDGSPVLDVELPFRREVEMLHRLRLGVDPAEAHPNPTQRRHVPNQLPPPPVDHKGIIIIIIYFHLLYNK
jgi:hypothetical protein